MKRPESLSEFIDLEASLESMGLEKLLFLPWNIQSVSYVQDFMVNTEPQSLFELRGDRRKLEDIDFIGQAFQCPTDGMKGMLQRNDLHESYFDGQKNLSHGWRLKQCNDARLAAVLNFLLPILHPKKPTFIPISLANTVIASLTAVTQSIGHMYCWM